MTIKHNPVFDTKKIAELYSKKDGVPVKYVCTTDITHSDMPVDVFYRETPHPEFGNRYFGLLYDHMGGVLITNADRVEELEFGMVVNDEGDWEYSQSHHDYKSFDNGSMIDGGRQYIRSSGHHVVWQLKEGEFIKNFDDVEVKNVYYIGRMSISNKKYTGNKPVKFEYPLILDYHGNFSKKMRRTRAAYNYFFVVDGEICKIGQSSGELSDSMAFYEKAGQDDPGPSRFAVNCLIREELSNGKCVEVYIKYREPDPTRIEGLTEESQEEVISGAKEMEKASNNEFKKIKGRLPKWNFQESNNPIPRHIQSDYAEYRKERGQASK